ncbi:helix-turn-helix domain-containing protein [Clostridium combesii]|uniref:helix-turn-helix domain-containing protein n=1 Tax=Clostridium combesii TaxID=39481 RepID=UPI0038B282DD
MIFLKVVSMIYSYLIFYNVGLLLSLSISIVYKKSKLKPYEKSKEIRINKNITTYELSELIGIPQSTISKIENSKRKIKIESLQKLANTFHVSINIFLIMRIL